VTGDAWGALAAVTAVAALTLGVALTEPPTTPTACERHGGTPRAGTAIIRLRPAPYTYCERTPR
jgi:hypothetical protein